MKDHDIQNDEQDYQGRETLADLTIANNYNTHLIELVLKQQIIGGKVLDFGAGNGAFAARIQKTGSDVFAAETDIVLQEEIEALGIPIIHDIGAAGFKFDLIYSLNVLEHIKDDVEALELLSRNLTEDGKLVIYVPALEILYSKFDHKIGHYRRYNKQRLRETAEKAGLRVESLEFHDPVGFFAALAYRLLDNSGNVKPGSIRVFDKFLYPISRLVQPIFKHAFGKNLLLVATKE